MRRLIFVSLSTIIGVLCLLTLPTTNTIGSSKTHLSTSLVHTWKLPPLVTVPTVVTSQPPVTTLPAPVPTTTVPVTVSSTTAPVVNPPTPVPSTSTTAPPASPSTGLTSDGVVEAWTKVAVCEEGGWGTYGFPNYPNSLGINADNWYKNGGGSDLSIGAQIAVGERIAARYVHAGFIPDQNGCAAW